LTILLTFEILVRSSPCFIGFDLKHNIGFLDNPQRFNVAGTGG